MGTPHHTPLRSPNTHTPLRSPSAAPTPYSTPYSGRAASSSRGRGRSPPPPIYAIEDFAGLQQSLYDLRTEIEVMRNVTREEARARAVEMRSAREARIEAVLQEWIPLPEGFAPAPGGKEFLRVRRRERGGSCATFTAMHPAPWFGTTRKRSCPRKAQLEYESPRRPLTPLPVFRQTNAAPLATPRSSNTQHSIGSRHVTPRQLAQTPRRATTASRVAATKPAPPMVVRPLAPKAAALAATLHPSKYDRGNRRTNMV